MTEPESISDTIKILYDKYRSEKIKPSPKQVDLIHKLGGEVKENSTCFETQKQIKFLLGSQKITIKQQKLLSQFPKNHINTILDRDVIIEDVTRFELSRIINILQTRNLLAPNIFNHPIKICQDYEYGWQECPKCPDNKLYYLVFYDFLMADIDGVINIDELTNNLLSLCLTARLYRTYNGYHIFITSQFINHKSRNAKFIMDTFNCDLFYNAFSFLNGFKVRLNPKIRDDEYIAAEYIQTIGNEPENIKLLNLLLIHDKYILQHKNHTNINEQSVSPKSI